MSWLNLRNARWTAAGLIDLELEHPELGWIEFTASPDDTELLGRVVFAQAVGGTVAPYVAPAPVVPQVVTMRQARLALLGAGLLAQVAPALVALPSPQREAAEIEWEFSPVLKREYPLVTALATALSLSSAQVDALFVAADAL